MHRDFKTNVMTPFSKILINYSSYNNELDKRTEAHQVSQLHTAFHLLTTAELPSLQVKNGVGI
jgi:hypothetical protein